MYKRTKFWYIPEYCRFIIPVEITDYAPNYGRHNCLVDIDEPIGHSVFEDELFTSLKDARLALRMMKDEDRMQEISNNHMERVFGNRKFRKYKNWYHILRQWRRLRIQGIVGTWGDIANDLSLKDYKNKKVYRIK